MRRSTDGRDGLLRATARSLPFIARNSSLAVARGTGRGNLRSLPANLHASSVQATLDTPIREMKPL